MDSRYVYTDADAPGITITRASENAAPADATKPTPNK